MLIMHLKEFTVCAKHMNMRRAAAEIHIGQSNLSKHMRQLEEEVGCKLLLYEDNKLTLTEAGARFLIGAQALMAMYDKLKLECNAVGASNADNPPPQAICQQHSIIDNGVAAYYRLIDRLKRSYPELQLLFAKGSRRYFGSELRSGRIDMCLEYSFGEPRNVKADYVSKGFVARYLASENLIVWLPRGHKLDRPEISPSDLKGVPIMTPADASAPLRQTAQDLCRAYGFEAQFFTAATTNQPEYLAARHPGAVYLYPQSFAESLLLKAHTDMVAVPFSENIQVNAFAVTYPTQNPFSPNLIQFLESDGL